MFKRKDEKTLDIPKVNQTVSLLHKILKITYILIIIIGIYAATLIFKEWGIFTFIKVIFKVLIPFFIGFIIAWLFNPIVTYLHSKKVNRVLGSALVYLVFLGLIFLIVYSIIPVATSQINDLVGGIPSLITDITDWIDNVFKNLGNDAIDLTKYKDGIFEAIANIGRDISNGLPAKVMSILTSLISGVGVFALGLIIGFYMLLNFDNVSKTMISFFPKRIRNDASELLHRMNTTLQSYVHGTLIVASSIFVLSYVGFLIIGVEAPLLFALFCGITDIIPYAGPYIGGAPVTLIAFSQDPAMGIIVIIYIAIIQCIEGNFLQPVIMGKTMKIHPVTILIGLLIFGHFFGIVGMIVSTPLVALLKTIFMFFDEKFSLTKYKKK